MNNSLLEKIRKTEIPFLTERRNSIGEKEYIETLFDNALLLIKLYELTGEKKYLIKGLNYFKDKAVMDGNFVSWDFSPSLNIFHREADTTIIIFIYFAIADKLGIKIPDCFSPTKNIYQFQELLDKSGGIKTWFGDNVRYQDVDPIVNTTLIYLYIFMGIHDDLFNDIRAYLNNCLTKLNLNSSISKYYIGGSYFAKRMAALSNYDPGFLTEESKDSLESFLLAAKPQNALEAAFLSIASSYRNLEDKAEEYNKYLISKRQSTGFYPYEVFYTQKQIWFYGHPFITTLYVLEAFELAKRGVKKTDITI